MSRIELIKKSISENLINLRKEKGLYIDDLCKKLCMSKRMYIEYEKGRTIPKFKKIVDICNYYDISFDWLIGFSVEKY